MLTVTPARDLPADGREAQLIDFKQRMREIVSLVEDLKEHFREKRWFDEFTTSKLRQISYLAED